ncbi:MAG: winged helix-turn-helix domain-containing protein [archaeon]
MEHEPAEPRGHFELYATSDGIMDLRDPTRIRIVHLLAESAKEFEEIVAFMGKAKSTISAHLDTLEQRGIIKSITNEQDARKKSYALIGKLIAMSSKNEPLIYVTDKKFFRNLD